MRDQVLHQFEHPWLLVIGMLLFMGVFLGVLFWVSGKKTKKEFTEAEQLPLSDGFKVGGTK